MRTPHSEKTSFRPADNFRLQRGKVSRIPVNHRMHGSKTPGHRDDTLSKSDLSSSDYQAQREAVSRILASHHVIDSPENLEHEEVIPLRPAVPSPTQLPAKVILHTRAVHHGRLHRVLQAAGLSLMLLSPQAKSQSADSEEVVSYSKPLPKHSAPEVVKRQMAEENTSYSKTEGPRESPGQRKIREAEELQKKIEKLISKGDDNAGKVAELYEEMGNKEKAAEYYNRAGDWATLQPDTILSKTKQFIGAGNKFEKAWEYYHKANSLLPDPKNFQERINNLCTQAVEYFMDHDAYDMALMWLQRAGGTPNVPNAKISIYRNAGDDLYGKSKYGEAIKWYRKGEPDAFCTKGHIRCLIAQTAEKLNPKDFPQAEKYLAEANELNGRIGNIDPKFHDAMNKVMEQYRKMLDTYNKQLAEGKKPGLDSGEKSNLRKLIEGLLSSK